MTKKANKLRLARIIVAAVFFVGALLLLLDISGALHKWLGWIAKVQFIPALIALNLIPFGIIAILTLIFGRFYCSTICPLGIYQDIISHAGGKKKNFSKAKTVLRWIFVAIAVAAFFLFMPLLGLLDPYSIFGKAVTNILQPIYILGNNLLALISEHIDSYAFYSKDVWLKSLPTLIISVALIAAISIMAYKNGRTWCNTVCPVGTILGAISRFSFFKVRIDEDKCISCGLCEKKCKASCIDAKNHEIDYSRCVGCMDCIDNCSKGAISYKSAKKSSENKPDNSRRAVLTGVVLLAGSALTDAVAQEVNDGGLAEITKKKAPKRETPLKPAGSKSLKNFSDKCTACQLCVSKCPNDVLRPSKALGTFMQPEMSFEKGYCRPECTVCSEVCPTGAISLIEPEDKTHIQTGHAVWIRENCVVITDDVNCGNCARHCPSGAISMVHIDPSDTKSRKVPAVNEERCIGCGACENLCPARPLSAIYVEGHLTHKDI